ncbi:hypothetical protein BGZ94_005280 [Podila epigama]|nr:hypothetical protein BGZ94_005280 [Podila epigama]
MSDHSGENSEGEVEEKQGLASHVKNCIEKQGLSFPPFCPCCAKEIPDLIKHIHDCFTWEVDRARDAETRIEFETQAIRVIKHAASLPWFEEMFEPTEITMDGGERAFALLLRKNSKRVREGSLAYVRAVRPRVSPSPIKDIQVNLALGPHPYGHLVYGEDFVLLGGKDPICRTKFRGNGPSIASTLSGLMIQSGENILWALKVEVYGRASSEDPHCQDIAMPPDGLLTVGNFFHDNTNKAVIGTNKWNELVTMAVILTTGDIIVGPNNTQFHPHPSSNIWIRTTSTSDLLNVAERQTRSKFNETTTFQHNAAVVAEFDHYKSLPVTLKTLWEFKWNCSWSGVKLGAYIFHQLYEEGKLKKAELEQHLEETRNVKGKASNIICVVEQVAKDMKDIEEVPVTSKVNRHLTDLADKLCNAITTLNQQTITKEVKKRIETMLTSKE